MTGHRLVVWYNTRCPVCDAGIDWQRNKLLAVVRAGHLSFRDINEEPTALSAYGASLDEVRRRLHATDESGHLIVGADVAIALWRLTSGERWLASLFGNRLMLPVTRFFYDRFADVLFTWNRWKGHHPALVLHSQGATNSTLLFSALPASLPLDPTGARCATPAVRSRGAPMR